MAEYGILGPLTAHVDGQAADLGGSRARAVLAILLLERNRVVSVDRLVDLVWGEDPPPTAEAALHGHISRLRRALGADAIETRSPGYLLRTDARDVDAERFDTLVDRARDLPPAEAAAVLREALALWRGSALADLADQPFAEATIARLDEAHLGAIEARVDADLEAGRHDALIGELEVLVSEHPYRERLHGQRILALYRAGRQAEALAAYRAARAALDEGLGIDPGPDLQALETRILQQDPTLRAPVADVQRAIPREVTVPAAAPPSSSAGSPAPGIDRPVAGPTPAISTAPAVNRRTVTVVFADVAGSTSLGEQLDPEMMRSLMTRWFATIKDALEHHGGTVEKFIGDAVMAVFGIPVLHEDDALRAVRAAEEIQARLTRLGGELEAQQGVTLRTRIGVNTGEVVAGDPTTGQNLVTGDAVNVAARLEQAAAPGEVLMGAATYRLVRDAVTVEAVAQLALKGKEHPVAAYRLGSVTPGADPLARRLDTVLVGRERELRRIQGTFDDVVAEGRCHLLTLLGAAGVGKTRLVAELARLVASDARVLRGRCLSYGDGITFWPLREIVASVAGFSDRESAEVARARIAALLAGTEDAAVIADRVEQALGMAASTAPRDELFWAISRLLQTLAGERPLVVVFDDLQWAEPTLLDLIDHLAEHGGDRPLLLLCAARPDLLEQRPTWGGGHPNATTITLDALAATAAERLLHDLVGPGTLPVSLRDRLVVTAEGNPLFLQELIAGLVDDGRLSQTPNGWAITGDIDEIAIPPTISALVATRLDRLSPVDRSVIGHAAVIGRSFDAEALSVLLPELRADEIERSLRALSRAALLRAEETGTNGGGSWRFRHLLIRDLAYASLSKGTRATLHARFAAWLPAHHRDRIDELEEIVGHHAEQAYTYRRQLGTPDPDLQPLADEAAHWLARAGRRAFAHHDGPAAESLLGRAAALLPPAGAARLDLRLLIAELRRGRGDLAGAREELGQIAQLAGTAGLDGVADRAGILLAWLRSTTDPDRWLDEAEAVTGAAEPRLVRAGDDEGLSLLWGLRMDTAMARGKVAAARTAAERAIEHGTRAGDAWQITRRSRANLAELSVVDDTPIPVAEARCLELLGGVGQERRLAASILFSLARLQAMRGDTTSASASVARGRELADALGLLYGRVAGAETAAFVALVGGDAASADALLRDATNLVVVRGDQRAATRLGAQRAEVLVRLGDDAAADRLLTDVRAGSGTQAAALETRLVLAGVAAILAARGGSATEARSFAREAVAVAETGESPVWLAHALALSAEALSQLGDDEGSGQAAAAIARYQAKGATRIGEQVRAQPWSAGG